ncbi:translation initiation factor [Halomarina halobia]|uniref:Protein translation factor SUI1 homolog n=1 Tax=Halomarina halobia TaxID=3033386 RepID=A0ABD6A9Q5_9EURY
MADKDLSDIAGLPSDLGIGEDLARAEQVLSVRVERRRYGKPVTIVEGFDEHAIDLDELASTLKRRLATGGTVDDDRIELQGDHANRLPDVLRDEGFTVE